jgi:hypothetical protein
VETDVNIILFISQPGHDDASGISTPKRLQLMVLTKHSRLTQAAGQNALPKM